MISVSLSVLRLFLTSRSAKATRRRPVRVLIFKKLFTSSKDQRNNWVRTRENVSGFTIATYRFVVGEEKDWVQITKTEFSEK